MAKKPKASRTSKKSKKKELSTSQHINVSDVRGSFLYAKDEYIWQYLKVQPISTALLTEDEKSNLTMRMTREISPLKMPFKIIFLTRPTDVRQIVEYYENIKANTFDTKKRDNITKTIRYFSSMATSGGVLERQTFIALRTQSQHQTEEDLSAKTLEFRNALLGCGVQCTICDEVDILNMLGLFYNPVFSVDTPIDVTPNYVFMEGHL